ncbi:MAG: glycosyltransferase family 87 protein [Candidatus Obscuribacterales bacterium]|jgi:hypothetical protein
MKKTFALIGLLTYLSGLALPTFCFFAAFYTLFNQNDLLVRIEHGAVGAQDFVHYYIFGQMAASPDAHQVYNEAAQSRWFHNLVLETKGLVTTRSFWALFTPMVFPFCLPMAYMSLNQAYIAFVILSAVALVTCFPLALNAQGKRSFICNAAIIFCIIANIQGTETISKGQPAFFLLALESLFFWGWIKKNDWVTGMSVGILFFKPHYGLFFLTPIVVARRWRAFLTCVATTTLLVGLGGLLIGFDNVINFPRIITHQDTGSCLGMVSLRYVTTRFLSDLQALHASLGIMVVGLLLNLVMWWNGVRQSLNQTWLICCTVLLCLLASPHTYHYDLLMLGLLAVSISPPQKLHLTACKISYAIYRPLLFAMPALSWITLLVFTEKGGIGSSYDPIQSEISIALNVALLILALVCSFDKAPTTGSQLQ